MGYAKGLDAGASARYLPMFLSDCAGYTNRRESGGGV